MCTIHSPGQVCTTLCARLYKRSYAVFFFTRCDRVLSVLCVDGVQHHYLILIDSRCLEEEFSVRLRVVGLGNRSLISFV